MEPWRDELYHYASKYYDPVKAHAYYMKTRKLKGRKPQLSTSAWLHKKRSPSNKEYNYSLFHPYTDSKGHTRTISRDKARETYSSIMQNKDRILSNREKQIAKGNIREHRIDEHFIKENKITEKPIREKVSTYLSDEAKKKANSISKNQKKLSNRIRKSASSAKQKVGTTKENLINKLKGRKRVKKKYSTIHGQVKAAKAFDYGREHKRR